VLTPVKVAVTLAALFALLLVALMIGLGIGPSAVTPHDVASVLFGDSSSNATADIVLRIRLPRIILAAVVGAALAVSGVLFQALLRNPLADPYVLGVSGGAALGGIAMLSFGGGIGLGYAAVPPAAFAGALVTTFLLYAIAAVSGRVSSTNLLLTGVVFNAFASAATVRAPSISLVHAAARGYIRLHARLPSASNETRAPRRAGSRSERKHP
jgi:iron complex transport system permease protein